MSVLDLRFYTRKWRLSEIIFIDILLFQWVIFVFFEWLDVLTTQVEAWERKHFPLDLPDPVEAIKFRMEQTELTPKDL